MNENALLSRITSAPEILSGKPVIRGSRLSVEFILNLLAHRSTHQEILSEYNDLQDEDIQACLLFASRSLSSAYFMPLVAETA